jgi:hypothetical protein
MHATYRCRRVYCIRNYRQRRSVSSICDDCFLAATPSRIVGETTAREPSDFAGVMLEIQLDLAVLIRKRSCAQGETSAIKRSSLGKIRWRR